MAVGDCVGKKFGRLTVLEEWRDKEKGKTRCKCKCECDNVITLIKAKLKKRITNHCTQDCVLKDYKVDLKDKVFGNLKVLKRLKKNKHNDFIWLCECVCGKETKLTRTSLTSGHTKSCGCLKKITDIKKMKDINNQNVKEKTNLKLIGRDKKNKNNTSGACGVCKINKKGEWIGKWASYISFQKKRIHLGTFDNFEDAIEARKEAEEKYFNPILDKYNKE